MANKANKVKYGLKKVHYAKQKVDEGGKISFEKPVAWPGAVSLSLDPQGEISKFYADNIVYYTTAANNGYEGDLETALVPDDFRKDILGETVDDKNIMTESADAIQSPFALLFEFDGDVKATRHVLYNCTATRAPLSSQTKEDTVEPATEALTISAAPLPDGRIKAKTMADASDEDYNGWYTTVYYPDLSEAV